ncbi:hypothetical protein V8F20_001684 [Naviculisporaceae sp. PSN 640]
MDITSTVTCIPKASVTRNLLVRKFPPEIIANICDFLDERSLASLSRVARALNPEAERALYNRASQNRLRGQNLLLWAADNGQNRVLEQILRRGVDPNASYNSFITRARLNDVFAAQGGRAGAFRPKRGRHLDREIKRELACRRAHQSHFGMNIIPCIFWEQVQQHFGPFKKGTHWTQEQYWRWGALHLAVYRGDEEATRLLLQYGANVNQSCSGVCDCLIPRPDVVRYRGPGMRHTTWTPLHISICQGHPTITKLLLEHSADMNVGSSKVNLDSERACHMTAFHTAAIEGSMETLRLLLDHTHSAQIVDKRALSGNTALDMAALSGHIDSVIRELCAHPLGFQFGKKFGNPLTKLCESGLIDEATKVFQVLEELRRSGQMKARINYQEVYSTALWAVCDFWSPSIVNFDGRGSLRATQDKEIAFPNGEPVGSDAEDTSDLDDASCQGYPEFRKSWIRMWRKRKPFMPARVRLAQALLKAGADPDFTARRGDSPRDSCLKLAIATEFLEMAELLLTSGAKVDDHDDPKVVEIKGMRIEYELKRKRPILRAITDSLSPERHQFKIFRTLLEHGALQDLSQEAKEDIYMRVTKINWAFEALKALDAYYSVSNLSDEQMIRMMESAACCFPAKEHEDQSELCWDWLIDKYAKRLAGPASAAQRKLCKAMNKWASGNDQHNYYKTRLEMLVHRVKQLFLAHSTISG